MLFVNFRESKRLLLSVLFNISYRLKKELTTIIQTILVVYNKFMCNIYLKIIVFLQ